MLAELLDTFLPYFLGLDVRRFSDVPSWFINKRCVYLIESVEIKNFIFQFCYPLFYPQKNMVEMQFFSCSLGSLGKSDEILSQKMMRNYSTRLTYIYHEL